MAPDMSLSPRNQYPDRSKRLTATRLNPGLYPIATEILQDRDELIDYRFHLPDNLSPGSVGGGSSDSLEHR